jgi:hypothetical protein
LSRARQKCGVTPSRLPLKPMTAMSARQISGSQVPPRDRGSA